MSLLDLLLIVVVTIALGFTLSVVSPLLEEIGSQPDPDYSEVRLFLNTTIGDNTSTYEKIKIIEHVCKHSLYPTSSCVRAMDEVYLP